MKIFNYLLCAFPLFILSSCGGSGGSGGSGGYYNSGIPSRYYDGDGEGNCEACDGTGMVDEDCEECDGEGYRECEECAGTGEASIFDEYGNEIDTDICEECDGEGRIMCEECDGEGKREVECDECGGSGYIEEDYEYEYTHRY